ncbi:MAG: ABC transporter ATP-binding protein [Anaerolineae bacterium]|nr:ABC transporter ATP-binding protein [Caldilineales bacterium]MDW8268671.1 ABC transporter ATP-binding protein [Anaerolineae bacterium]
MNLSLVLTHLMAKPMGSATPRADGPEWSLELRAVSKHFKDVGAARGVSFRLRKGQLLALLGPSGCGKTTTLRLIAGFEEPDAGEIVIGGRLVAGPGVFVPPEQRRVGMVFQEYALFPHLNVADNVRFGLRHYAGDAERRVRDVLELVGLTGLEKRMPHELSGGQQQRVALARALAPEPDLILLDEPFSNLDAGLRVRVRAEVRTILKEAAVTAVFVTHDQEEALSLVDQVAVMMDGVVLQVATPRELYYQPATRAVAAFVGDSNFLPGIGHGRWVECELGRLDTQVEVWGPVEVLIRPENIDVRPASQASGCRVRRVTFFGHDQLIGLDVQQRLQLDARTGPTYQFFPGQPVEIRVLGPVMAYPRSA